MTKSVIAVHDISCFGRCSLTVALPIISGCGVNCTVLPTALLSTHTGGFNNPVKIDLTDNILPIYNHWKNEGLSFDGIYTGYLGSTKQPDILITIFGEMKKNGAKIFVDPVMGDNGKLYSSIDKKIVEGMRRMVAMSDIVMPNITEACLLLDIPYSPMPHDEKFVETLLKGMISLGASQAVITGVNPDKESVGACYLGDNGKISGCYRTRTQGSYHGSGDMFGSVLVGRLMHGDDMDTAVETAVDFVAEVIKASAKEKMKDTRAGLCFERELWRLNDG